MSIKHRMKRALGVGLAGAMVLALMPAGVATADMHDDICEDAPANDFTDASSISSQQREFVDCMAAYGIAQGFTDNTFRPGLSTNRQQMALFIARFVVQAEDGLNADGEIEIPAAPPAAYTDRMQATADGRDAIDFLTDREVVEGYPDNTYRPGTNVTREQMASFIARAIEAVGGTLPEGDDDRFTDADTFADSHADNINALAAAGVIQGFPDNTYRPKNPVTRQQMAAFIINGAAHLDSQGLWNGEFIPVDDPAAPIGPNETFTNAPELVSVERLSSDLVRFNFDTTIPGVQAESMDFRLYYPNGEFDTPLVIGGEDQVSISGQSVTARYAAGVVPAAVRAGVRTAAVATGTGLPSIAGDFPLRATAAQINPIDPDLIGVGNYRFADELALGVNRVLVDFTFRDTAGVAAARAADLVNTDFYLIGVNSERFEELGEPRRIDTTTTPGQTTVTVAFAADPTEVPVSQLRRGVFDEGDIVWAANFANTGGTTVDPDLVSVTREGTSNIFRFTFDEAVSATDIEQDGFYLVDSGLNVTESTSAARLADATATTVRVQFGTLAADLTSAPVHAFVDEDTVLATDSTASDNEGQNRADSAPVTPPTVTDPPPGVTSALDLVSAERFQDVVTGRFTVRYTFDRAVGAIDAADYQWNLYDANGVRFQVNPAGGGITVVGNWVEISSANTGISDDQIEATVTVSVQTVDATDDTPGMTEGQADARRLTQR